MKKRMVAVGRRIGFRFNAGDTDGKRGGNGWGMEG